MIPLRVRLILIILTAASGPAAAQGNSGRNDPVTTDPAQVDSTYPPSTEELAFESNGSRLNGFFYLAPGKGPHPTVILLHGFPGNERNLDLAQALRRAGMNVLFFSYRGAWGSGGTFSFDHALEDVAAAIAFVRRDSSVAAFRVDPQRVSLLGHSMGGWLALMHAAADSSTACTVALDFWNVGDDGRRMPTDRRLDSTVTAYGTWLTGPGGPLRADGGGSALAAELKVHGEQWDPVGLAPALARQPLLLISTTANQSHARLVRALRAAQANRLTAVQWKTDHGFSDRRIRLARVVAGWLGQHCR
jgi:pimeloyl-ACP methyl ester carboxylesterase